MRIGRLCTFIFFIVFNHLGLAQKKEYYDKKNKLTSPDSSFYFTVGKQINGHYEDTLRLFYSNSEKRLGQLIYKEGYLSGPFTLFHENGKLKTKGLNNLGRPIGYVMNWSASGTPNKTIYFPEEHGKVSELTDEDFLIISYWNQDGKQLVNNGNGYCDCFFDEIIAERTEFENEGKVNYSFRISENSVRWIGKVKDGLRDSVWSVSRNGVQLFKEVYALGVLREGVSLDSDGTQYKYTVKQEMPLPKGGMSEFYNNVGSRINYPANARRTGTEGKVFVEFVVEKDGTISNVRSIKSPSESLSAEAVRVVKSASKWIPAKQRGKPVSFKMVMPIIFKLG